MSPGLPLASRLERPVARLKLDDLARARCRRDTCVLARIETVEEYAEENGWKSTVEQCG